MLNRNVILKSCSLVMVGNQVNDQFSSLKVR